MEWSCYDVTDPATISSHPALTKTKDRCAFSRSVPEVVEGSQMGLSCQTLHSDTVYVSLPLLERDTSAQMKQRHSCGTNSGNRTRRFNTAISRLTGSSGPCPSHYTNWATPVLTVLNSEGFGLNSVLCPAILTGFSLYPLVPLGKFYGNTLKWSTTNSFHIFLILFTNIFPFDAA